MCISWFVINKFFSKLYRSVLVPLGTSTHLPFVPAWVGSEESGAGDALNNQVAASGGFRHALKQAAVAASNSSFPAAAALKQAAAVANLSFPVAAASMSSFPAAAASMSSFPAAVAAATLKQATAAANSSFPAAVAASMSSFPEAAASMSSFPATAAAMAEFTSKSRRRRSRRRRWCRSIENPSASRVQAARPSLPIQLLHAKRVHTARGTAWRTTVGRASPTTSSSSCPGGGFKNTPMEGLLVPVFKEVGDFDKR
ncbi:uncharacterized protein [Oryza sativa Japonica Group]|uniref:uncharacterized protein isoform X2 n=1 Tax=Oryza sativa subsp. japonica TaxID=39947 RepID=UPI000775380E